MRFSFHRFLTAVGRALAAAALVAACAAPGGGADWNPAERVYPSYVADPRRARFGISAVQTDSELDDAGSDRATLEMGGRVDVVRFGPDVDPRDGMLLDVEAGFIGDFDFDESQDNLAWSGIYALHLSWLASASVALRFGFHHESSHIGDEFLLETGGPRIDYTREELLLGASWAPAPPWRLYGEYGYTVGRGNEDLQEPGRAQAGVEWASAALVAGEPGWYAASDVSSFEERDWAANVELQGGWAVPAPRGTWRFGALVYDGRSAIGQLSFDDETRVALGVWYDL
jgi:hypothetical protein